MYEKSLFPDLEYTFKHALTHEVAYGSVLQERRKALHTRHHGVDRAALPRSAGGADRAACPSRTARRECGTRRSFTRARLLKRLSAAPRNRQAGSLLEQAIAVLPHLPQTRATLEQAVDLRLASRPCLAPLGEYAQWLELAREAEPLAKALDDPRREALVHCSMTSALSVLGRSAEAIEHGERALAIAETLQEPTLRIIARYSLGLPHTLVGAFRTAIGLYERDVGLKSEQIAERLLQSSGAGIFQEAFTRLSYSISQSMSALCFAELGEFDQAAAASRAEREVRADARQSVLVRAIADAWLGFSHFGKGDLRTSASPCTALAADLRGR